MHWLPRNPGVTAALLGAIVGALGGFFLNVVVWRWWESRVLRRRVASALFAESRALYDRYERVLGKYIRDLKPGDPLDKAGGTIRSQNFFAVYDGSTQNLGLFGAEDVAAIVHAVTVTKGHIESINAFREIDALLSPMIIQLGSAGEHAAAVKLEERHKCLRVDYAALLKEESQEVVVAFEAALKALEKYLSPTARRRWRNMSPTALNRGGGMPDDDVGG